MTKRLRYIIDIDSQDEGYAGPTFFEVGVRNEQGALINSWSGDNLDDLLHWATEALRKNATVWSGSE